jgi:hypothetical protein
MDRYTAAAIGNNLSGALSSIGQMFDPRLRAQADQQRLTNEGIGLKNQGFAIDNQYAPKVFGSQIALNQARIGTEGAQQGKYNAEAELFKIRGDAGRQMLGPLSTNLTPIQQKIASAASAYGIDPTVALSIVGQESGFNPNTRPGTSSASGYFQFLDADRKKYGIGEGAPEDQQIDAGMQKMRENYAAAKAALGREPTAGEAYAVYYQGIGAGPKILQNPDASFRETLGQFGTGYADRVIKANPWLANINTNRDFINWSEQKMRKQGFLGQSQPVDMNRQVVLSNVFSGGGANDLAAGSARMSALNAGGNEQLLRNSATAISGNLPGAGEYGTTAEAQAYQERGLANAFNINNADNQSAQLIESAKIMAGSAGASGGSSGGGSTKNPLNTVEGAKFTNQAMAARFGIAGEDGSLMLDPAMRSNATAWESSVANLAEHGIPIQTAIDIADQKHKISSVARTGDGWGDGDPRMAAGEGFDPTPITPAEAAQIGFQYKKSSEQAVSDGGVDPQRLLAAAVLNPNIAALFQMASQQPASPTVQNSEISRSGIPVTGVAPSEVVAPATTALPGKAIGTERIRAEKGKSRDIGTDYNSATLGNIIRAADAEGVSMADIFATAASGSPENDEAIGRIFNTSRGLGVIQEGGRTAKDLRNALMDTRALQRANIDPSSVIPYFRNSTGNQAGQAQGMTYNPATRRLE